MSPKFIDKTLQRVQVGCFLRQHIVAGRVYAAGYAVAMKSQFTRQLIETPARAPTFYAAVRERAVGRTHPAQNRTELFVFVRREKTALEIDHQMLAHYSSFTSQGKGDDDEHDDKSGNHDDDIHEYEKR